MALVAWFLLPSADWFLDDPTMDFSIFILAGIMIVVGATWILMHNADKLIGMLGLFANRIGGLAPIFKMSMAYPLRDRFRTGITLAMFTLVVFTLVVGATTPGSFIDAFNDVDAYGGGFDVRATPRRRARSRTWILAADMDGVADGWMSVASHVVLPVEAPPSGTDTKSETISSAGSTKAFSNTRRTR